MKEKQDEERLLHELLEVVSLRNNIVDSIEVDRLRFALVQLSQTFIIKCHQKAPREHKSAPGCHLAFCRSKGIFCAESTVVCCSICDI